jgi:hypothetical protein
VKDSDGPKVDVATDTESASEGVPYGKTDDPAGLNVALPGAEIEVDETEAELELPVTEAEVVGVGRCDPSSISHS